MARLLQHMTTEPEANWGMSRNVLSEAEDLTNRMGLRGIKGNVAPPPGPTLPDLPSTTMCSPVTIPPTGS